MRIVLPLMHRRRNPIAQAISLVVGLVVSLASSYAGAIAIPQDRVAPILALMAASIVSRMGSASPEGGYAWYAGI